MEKERIRAELHRILQDQLGAHMEGEKCVYGGKAVTDETSLEADLGADSLDAIEMAMEFEDAFQIQITDEEISSLKTVGDVMSLVEAKLLS